MSHRSTQFVAGSLAVAAAGLAMRALLAGPRYSFRDKVVVITGGSRGLGLVMARKLAEEGAKLVICSRTGDQLARAEQELLKRCRHVLAIHCDITQPADAQDLIDHTLAQWGRVDVLINNAGIIRVGPLNHMQHADYEEAMNTHFWGPLHLINAVLPGMRKRRAGRIVNIGSIGGRVSVPHLLPYSASKFALTGLSEGLRAELAKDGIVVTTVSPGLMRTGSPRNAEFKGQHRAEYAWFALGGSLPLLSMSAESAADQTLAACRSGAAAVTLSLPARLADFLHGIFPGLTADVFGAVNRWLPGPSEVGSRAVRGEDSESWIAPSLLTTLSDRAAVRNNEL